MRKIPSLYERDWLGDTSRVTSVLHDSEACRRVASGEGSATRKYDGTACRWSGGALFARYDAKHGKVPPQGFEPAQPEPDAKTGHWPGWLQVLGQPEYRWHREAVAGGVDDCGLALLDRTYELVGPKVNGNRDGFVGHVLVPHGRDFYLDVPRDFDGLKEWLAGHDIEGLVFWLDGSPVCKVKRSDFGLPWPVMSIEALAGRDTENV